METKEQTTIKFELYYYCLHNCYAYYQGFRKYIMRRHDMRTKQAKRLLKQTEQYKNFDFQAYTKDIAQKRKQRKANQYQHTNILKNKIVIDFIANKRSINYIDYGNKYIDYGGRKHWAKNDFDKKVIAIIKKHYIASGRYATIKKAKDQHFELHKRILFELEANKRY